MPSERKKEIILKTENLYRDYKLGEQHIHALNNVNIEIHNNEFLAIVGKSGSGKSTLMHLIGLLDTPTHGKIYLNNKRTDTLDDKQLAHVRNKEIGFVFQAFNLLQRATALENVMLPLEYSDIPSNKWEELAIKMLNTVGLGNRIYNKSNELSGGQKQRVAIARALINNPSIVLADEPTGNLDSKTGQEIIELFQSLNKAGRTIVLVTHDKDLASKTQRRINLKDGRIVNNDEIH